MDGEGDAAALEYADDEAEADVEDGEDVSMGHQQRHHHLMRAHTTRPHTERGNINTKPKHTIQQLEHVLLVWL